MLQISCPYCGFRKEIPGTEIPEGARATCPKCRHQFPLRRVDGRPLQSGTSGSGPDAAEPAGPSVAPPDGSPKESSSTPEPPADGKVPVDCPACGFGSRVPREKIPPRPVNLTCKQCGHRFVFNGAPPPEQPPPPIVDHPLLRRTEEPAKERPRRRQLRKIVELFADSWQVFRRRILVLIGINLLGILLVGIGSLLLSSGIGNLTDLLGNNLLTGALTVLLVTAAGSLAVTWLAGATICAVVDESLSIREALGLGLQKALTFLWLFSLLGLVIGGGTLAVVIPGLIFSTLFLFAQYIVVDEPTRGMEALLKSREYVRGFFWPVLGRILLVSLFIGLCSALLGLVPIIGPLAGMLLWPFSIIAYHEIYRDLREMKPGMLFVCTRADKVKWLLAGCAGYLVIPLLAGALLMSGAIPSSLTVQSWSGTSPPSAPALVPQQPPTMADTMLYVYAVNYSGTVYLNGQGVYTFDGEPDVNYNATEEVRLRPGSNEVSIDYRKLKDAGFARIKLRLFRLNWDSGSETTMHEIEIDDPEGHQSFRVEYR